MSQTSPAKAVDDSPAPNAVDDDPNAAVATAPDGACIFCGRPAVVMCSACGPAVRYCSAPCQAEDWAVHRFECLRNRGRGVNEGGSGQEEEEEEEEGRDLDDPAELKFYMEQVYHIVQPGEAISVQITVYTEKESDSGGEVFLGSLQNALIILAQVVVATVAFVCLFKYKCFKILFGYIFIAVTFILFFMSYLLVLNLVQVFGVAVDYITLVFALWNFAVVGNVVIFWRGPLWLQQTYLVIMSSLMAFALTGLESWTTWLLLGILAIWDLVAVLCPFGPLRILIESSQSNKQEIPGLLYSVTMLYFGVSGGESGTIGAPKTLLDNGDVEARRVRSDDNSRPDAIAMEPLALTGASSSTAKLAFPPLGSEDDIASQDPSPTNRGANEQLSALALPGNNGDSIPSLIAVDEEDEEERSGLKLGLGDFVFYSVLIARAAMFDWVTTVGCVVAILTGLNMTILLLAIRKHALPALPISIAFGLLFYFASSYTLVPFTMHFAYLGVMV